MILEVEPDIELVGEATDGIEAVRLAKDTEPDVVLMDIRMPRDGRAGGDPSAARRPADQARGYSSSRRSTRTSTCTRRCRPGPAASSSRTSLRSSWSTPSGPSRTAKQLLLPTVTRRLIEAYVSTPPDAAPGRCPGEVDTLTPARAEILLLVARGLSNAEIAAEAVVSEPTVKTHIARILMKLGLRDRVQVVVYAYEHGLAGPRG